MSQSQEQIIADNKKEKNQDNIGTIISINGPIIWVTGLKNQKLGDMVEIGDELHLIGEIIKIQEKYTIVQAVEETAGLSLNDHIYNLGYPLSMELGPGLLNNIYDGIQRPLEDLSKHSGHFITRGIKTHALDRTKKWSWKPLVKIGKRVHEGDIIGELYEGKISHKILVPIGIKGVLKEVYTEDIHVDDPAFVIQVDQNTKKTFPLYQRWPIRKPRPYMHRLMPENPLITGVRVIDLLFPVAQGGTVAIPGGFGTGKTVVQHDLAKYADAEIIVYIGCGERGNEMADILEQFPKLKDPVNNRPLMERTVMIANTSNMPVSAREASIFAGITIAEYWRDQGKNVLLLADSTSRWAEALRELSGRLEEMPAERGYPAYLSTRLSNFYERAGYVQTVGRPHRHGSVTVVGAVSPPGGDFSEPVTKNTKRFVRAFWALDARLAYARHYPSINWNDSYSLYQGLDKYWDEHYEKGWQDTRQEINTILAKSGELENITQLIGEENLPPEQQLILLTSQIIKEGLLIQNSFNKTDAYSSPLKTLKLSKIILQFHHKSLEMIKKGVPVFRIKQMETLPTIKRLRLDVPNDHLEIFDEVIKDLAADFIQISRQYSDLF